MHKPAKYFLAAVFILIGSLTGLLLWYGKPSNVTPIATNQAAVMPSVDQSKLEEVYRVRSKELVAEVASAFDSPIDEGTKLAGKARIELLGLTVPDKFKGLHLQLVQASDKLLSFFQGGEPADKLASQDLITQAKNKYDWLN